MSTQSNGNPGDPTGVRPTRDTTGEPGTKTSFAASAYIFVTVVAGTTVPTPLYPLYQEKLGFGATQTTVLYATYALGILVSLIVFGRFSDALGRKPMLSAGVVLSLLSTVAFLTGTHLVLLYVGRILSGLAAGIFVATGTVSVMENAPPGNPRLAAAVATAANIGGAGLGILLAGFVAQFLPAPLSTAFVIHGALTVVAGIALIAVRERVTARPSAVRLQVPRLPPESRDIFLAAAPGAVTGYAVLGLFSAVAPNFMKEEFGISATAVTGTVVFLFYGFSGAAQLVLRTWADRTLMVTGSMALISSMVLLVLSFELSSLALLIISSALAGVGQGLLFMTGVRAITRSTTVENQTAATTAYFVLAYLSLSVPTIGVGLVATSVGLTGSAVIFATVITAGCMVGFLGLGRFTRDRIVD